MAKKIEVSEWVGFEDLTDHGVPKASIDTFLKAKALLTKDIAKALPNAPVSWQRETVGIPETETKGNGTSASSDLAALFAAFMAQQGGSKLIKGKGK